MDGVEVGTTWLQSQPQRFCLACAPGQKVRMSYSMLFMTAKSVDDLRVFVWVKVSLYRGFRARDRA